MVALDKDVVKFPLSVFDGVSDSSVVLKMNDRTFYVPQKFVELKNGFVWIDAWFWKQARRETQKTVKVKLAKPDWW
jgi:hypothetical protein